MLERIATNRKIRVRRKSNELKEQFDQVMCATLEEVFKHFDKDGNGSLDADELAAAFEAAGRPADDGTIRSAIGALDENNDGVVSLDEVRAQRACSNIVRAHAARPLLAGG
jgi:Ca2+-binding EF-hand superfamily protein